MRQFTIISTFLLLAECACAQSTYSIVGEWTCFEMTSDRLYRNFEEDFIYFYTKEDQERFKNIESKKVLTDQLDMLSKFSITFNNDNTFAFGISSNVEKGCYRFDNKNSYIILQSFLNSGSDTLKMKSNGQIQYATNSIPDNSVITFKRKGK